ncbi:metalloregulator ArsR/SmtB family transcription factor [Paraburkholderia sp. CNPSo 3274]|uniref:metalloregulator ArsR/SmtB family transcription factor n=1 Tax=Paraburkholderia sp. CNPSo 3274 TaxID=2940932 RepID=UPI0020B82335|nr:metalloregulator ArsR/SmtB family transcription factor [Paraburkholderia sp. CNPSo 3274]MCP3707202.1 metalloregulator ArsR/SmtB family transcription factor [Paraburkholderia sp. CNPSo 3274]
MTTTDVFGAIANPTRRRILDMLRGGPRAAGEIASSFAVNRPAISEHLQVLRLAGLVTEQACGRQRLYGLNAGRLRELAEWLHPFERYWEQRLDALTEVLDKDTQ